MPGSTLDPDNFNLPDRQLGRGHGTGERATAGRDTVAEDGQDIDTDQTFGVEQDDRDDPTGYQPSLKRSHQRPDQRG